MVYIGPKIKIDKKELITVLRFSCKVYDSIKSMDMSKIDEIYKKNYKRYFYQFLLYVLNHPVLGCNISILVKSIISKHGYYRMCLKSLLRNFNDQMNNWDVLNIILRLLAYSSVHNDKMIQWIVENFGITDDNFKYLVDYPNKKGIVSFENQEYLRINFPSFDKYFTDNKGIIFTKTVKHGSIEVLEKLKVIMNLAQDDIQEYKDDIILNSIKTHRRKFVLWIKNNLYVNYFSDNGMKTAIKYGNLKIAKWCIKNFIGPINIEGLIHTAVKNNQCCIFEWLFDKFLNKINEDIEVKLAIIFNVFFRNILNETILQIDYTEMLKILINKLYPMVKNKHSSYNLDDYKKNSSVSFEEKFCYIFRNTDSLMSRFQSTYRGIFRMYTDYQFSPYGEVSYKKIIKMRICKNINQSPFSLFSNSYNKFTLYLLVVNHRLDIIKILYNDNHGNYKLLYDDYYLIRVAVKIGYLEFIQWVVDIRNLKKEQILFKKNYIFRHAARKGYLHILLWFSTKFCLKQKHIAKKNYYAIRHAHKNGHYRIVEWIINTFNITKQDIRQCSHAYLQNWSYYFAK